MSLIASENMEVVDGLYKTCRSFLVSWGLLIVGAKDEPDGVEIDHYEVLYEVITAAKQDCGFCSMLITYSFCMLTLGLGGLR